MSDLSPSESQPCSINFPCIPPSPPHSSLSSQLSSQSLSSNKVYVVCKCYQTDFPVYETVILCTFVNNQMAINYAMSMVDKDLTPMISNAQSEKENLQQQLQTVLSELEACQSKTTRFELGLKRNQLQDAIKCLDTKINTKAIVYDSNDNNNYHDNLLLKVNDAIYCVGNRYTSYCVFESVFVG